MFDVSNWFLLLRRCNKRSSGLNYAEGETTETVILGVGPAKIQFEGAEMGVTSEDGGCKCGDSCTCDPCNCKWSASYASWCRDIGTNMCNCVY